MKSKMVLILLAVGLAGISVFGLTQLVRSTGLLVEKQLVLTCVDCPKTFEYMTDRSLAIDSAGQPHLAYGLDYLYYAWYDGAAWHHETLDPAPGVGENAAIALDGDDAPHIAYYDRAGEAIKYAHQDGSGGLHQL